MEISALIPIVGLVVLIGNIVVAVMFPPFPPKAMGMQLFIAGMTTLVIAVVDLLDPTGITAFERMLLFLAGCINCSVGYYMVLLEIQKRSV